MCFREDAGDALTQCQGACPSRENLIDSLEESEEQEIEQLWLDEAERRLAAYRAGAIPARAAGDVFAEAYEESNEDAPSAPAR